MPARRSGGLFEIADTTTHAAWVGSPASPDDTGIRYFAGIALFARADRPLGTLCVYGNAPRRLTPEQRTAFEVLAGQCASLLQTRLDLFNARQTLDLIGQQPESAPPVRDCPAEPAARAAAAVMAADTAGGGAMDIEAMHRDVFVQLPLGIGYAGRDGRFLWCNSAFEEMLQLDPGAYRNKTIRDLTYAADYEPNDRLLQDLWAGQIKSYAIEKRYIRADGSKLWVRVTAALVHDAQRRPVCTVGFLEDISARKEAEQALQQSRRMIDAVAENVPVALLACDTGGNITFYNRAAAELFSVGQRHRDEKAPADYYPIGSSLFLPDGVTTIPFEERPFARALRGETLTNLEFVVVPHGAAPRRQLVNACPLLGPDGESLGAVAVSQDITQLRQAEAEIERIHKELMDASRQAGMAEVATNVLHNVGNVLNSVNVSATLVADRLKRTKATGLAQVAALLAKQGDGLAGFIANDERGRQLPNYLQRFAAQLQAEHQAVVEEISTLRSHLDHIKDAVTMQQTYAKRCGVSETVAIADLVEDSLRMNSGALTRHHVILEREFAEVPTITVDKHRVLQILVNLVRNAKYACDESGRPDKRVTVGIARLGDMLRISVRDNGIGIAPENMAQLFTHGFTTRKSGHGFGLHSAALAASQLGGALSAHSEGVDLGASFIWTYP